ncbi:hypothetical protein FJZ31_41510 [Candidatus Poribacteria bacterium]|nr:hypothetical protein [Candidatus Poribacteria bacterium]
MKKVLPGPNGASVNLCSIVILLMFVSATWAQGVEAKIAFISERDGNLEIYVMNADGSNPVKLTNNPAWDANPAWSPDGTKIAFQSRRDGNWEIYVMDADGANPVRLTETPLHEWHPRWSPDGTKIAFMLTRNMDEFSWGDIFVMNANGKNPVNLTNNPAWNGGPV